MNITDAKFTDIRDCRSDLVHGWESSGCDAFAKYAAEQAWGAHGIALRPLSFPQKSPRKSDVGSAKSLNEVVVREGGTPDPAKIAAL